MEIGTLDNLTLIPDTFTSTSQTISVETTSRDGYSVTFETSGNTTDLRLVGSDNIGIPTITLPNGSGTIKSSAFKYEYGYSTDGKNFKPVPRVDGSMDIIGSTSVSNAGSPDSYTLTYGVKTPEDIPSGTYVRTFIITASANNSSTCPPGYVCYNDNGGNGDVVMDDQPAESNSSVTLMAPKYQREGYGFLAWNTKEDGTGVSYGPNQTIQTGDLSENGLSLYAKWIASSGTIQNWSGCEALPIGSTTALTDIRDGNVYTVAKLVDHECWMAENLRLDFSNSSVSITSENTNNPGEGFMSMVNSHPASSSDFCTTDTSACTNKIQYNNGNITGAEDWSVYAYGAYYNWYTATAGYGTRSVADTNGAVAGDICPKGWKLPTGRGISGNLAKLDIALGGTGTNQKNPNTSGSWRSFPVNLVYSGEFNGTTIATGESGHYHASTANSLARSNNLWIVPSSVSTNSNGAYKSRGQAIRCMAVNSFTIEFDKNTQSTVSGTMKPQEITRGVEENLTANTFSIEDTTTGGYRFLKWNTKADGSGTDYADGAAVRNLAAAGEKITLYAQWEEYSFVDITVAFADYGTSKVSFANSIYGDREVTENGGVVKLVSGKSYALSMELASGYEFVNWSATNGSLGNANTNPTTYNPNGTATLTVATRIREGKLYLQDITLASCTTTPTVAYDNRDEEGYLIQRLDDGKCWMLDNLRLGSTSNIAPLTTANTNIASNGFTLPASGTVNSYLEPQLDASRANTTSTMPYGIGSGKIGVYYNYCAASAGMVCSSNSTSNTDYDICPKGWRLPNGNKNSGDFASLYAAYGSKASQALTALSANLSGYINSRSPSSVTGLNSNGYFWSSTSYNANKSSMLDASRNGFGFSGGGVRNNGLSIRCRLK